MTFSDTWHGEMSMMYVTGERSELVFILGLFSTAELLGSLRAWSCDGMVRRQPLTDLKLFRSAYATGDYEWALFGKRGDEQLATQCSARQLLQQMAAHLVNAHGFNEESRVCSLSAAQHALVRAMTAFLMD